MNKRDNTKKTNNQFETSNDNKVVMNAGSSNVKPLWGGIFNNTPTPQNKGFSKNQYKLMNYAISSMQAQIKMQIKRDIIESNLGKKFTEVLNEIKKELTLGIAEFPNHIQDVYDLLEWKVKEKSPEIAENFYLAKSKNEQSVGNLKLWIRDAYDNLDSAIQSLQASLIDKSEENVKTLMPSFSHMQVYNPISLGYQFMSYVELFGRDRSRMKDAKSRLSKSPFGSNAMAGSSYNINSDMVAKALGFSGVQNNALDAISNRDFALEFLTSATIAASNISRVIEDIILWNSSLHNFVTFPESHFANNKTLSPFKRNLNSAELIRSGTGKIYGSLVNAMTTLKSLPTGYSEDLSDIFEPVVEAYDVLLDSLVSLSSLIADLIVNRKEMKEAAQHGFSVANDMVDWFMINTNIGFNKANTVTKAIIDYAIETDTKLSLIPIEDLQKIEPSITDEIYGTLIPSRAMIRRRTVGGSNPVQVRKTIRSARRRFL